MCVCERESRGGGTLNCVHVFRMKGHFSQYEPLMQQLKHKYQVSHLLILCLLMLAMLSMSLLPFHSGCD